MGKEVRMIITIDMAQAFEVKRFFKERNIKYKGTSTIKVSKVNEDPLCVEAWTMYLYQGDINIQNELYALIGGQVLF